MDIVGSISKIPDALKRSVYIKECAQRMEMSEQLLHTEINKRLQKASQKEYNKQNYTKGGSFANKNEGTDKRGNNKKGSTGNSQQDNIAQKTITNECQELDIVRILINFGDKLLDDDSTVAEFILLDLLDLFDLDILDEFDHKTCSEIFGDYLKNLKLNKKLSLSYFTHHINPEIAKLSIDLVAGMEQHEFSAGWERLNVFLNTQELPEKNHVADAKSGILRFKLKKIERMIAKNHKDLKKVQSDKNDSDILILMTVHQRLIEKRGELAKQLNTVVLR